MKRRIGAIMALVLACVLLLAAVSCNKDGEGTPAGTTAGAGSTNAATNAATTTAATTQEPDPKDNIPNENGDGAIVDDSTDYDSVWG